MDNSNEFNFVWPSSLMRWGLLLKVECFRFGDLFLRRMSTGEWLGSRFQRSLWLYAALLRLRDADRERERDLRDLRPLDLKHNKTTNSNAEVIKSDLQRCWYFRKSGFTYFIFLLNSLLKKYLCMFFEAFVEAWKRKKKKVTLPWSRPSLL